MSCCRPMCTMLPWQYIHVCVLVTHHMASPFTWWPPHHLSGACTEGRCTCQCRGSLPIRPLCVCDRNNLPHWATPGWLCEEATQGLVLTQVGVRGQKMPYKATTVMWTVWWGWVHPGCFPLWYGEAHVTMARECGLVCCGYFCGRVSTLEFCMLFYPTLHTTASCCILFPATGASRTSL